MVDCGIQKFRNFLNYFSVFGAIKPTQFSYSTK